MNDEVDYVCALCQNNYWMSVEVLLLLLTLRSLEIGSITQDDSGRYLYLDIASQGCLNILHLVTFYRIPSSLQNSECIT